MTGAEVVGPSAASRHGARRRRRIAHRWRFLLLGDRLLLPSPARAGDPWLTVLKNTLRRDVTGLVLGGAASLVTDDDHRGDALRWGFVIGTFGRCAMGAHRAGSVGPVGGPDADGHAGAGASGCLRTPEPEARGRPDREVRPMKSSKRRARKAPGSRRVAPAPVRRPARSKAAAPARRATRPIARPAVRQPSDAAAQRIRELEAEVERLREALAEHERAGPPPPETPTLEAVDATAPETDESAVRKTPIARSVEEEEPFEDYDEEPDFLDSARGMLLRRQELDRERADRELELGDEPFWWICPKCGEHLSEHEFDNLKVERCENCGSLCVDRGEIDLLLLFSEEDRALAHRVRGLLQ